MQTYVSQSVELAKRYWRMSLVRGFCAINFGLLAIFWPHLTFFLLLYVFGVYAIIEGFLLLMSSFSLSRASYQREAPWTGWKVLMVEGFLSIILGVLSLVLPVFIGILALYVVAGWALVRGISALTQMRARGWVMGVIGVLAIILGVVLFFNPIGVIHSFLWIIGMFALIAGILMVVWGLYHNSRSTRHRRPFEPAS
jgi:uncharacterized membrane protein HdeD (DUF308 family)